MEKIQIKKFNTNTQAIDYNYLGALGSTLCMIHCVATPFIFAAQATVSTTCSEISPTWWKMIDIFFLVITYIAIYFSSKSTNLNWIPASLYFFWTSFALLVINNFFQIFNIPHSILYIPAICLSTLHLYNRRYCKCDEDKCCLN